MIKVYQSVLFNEDTAAEIVEQINQVFDGQKVDAKVTPFRGKEEVLTGRFSKPAEFARNTERHHLTNSTHLGLVFTRFAFAFESNDDALVEWLGAQTVRIRNQREPRTSHPIKEVILTLSDDSEGSAE